MENEHCYVVRWAQSNVLASCESEVRELMKQIDIMVQAKRQESEQREIDLEAQLDDKTRQVSLTKSALETRQKEVRTIRLYLNPQYLLENVIRLF